MKKIRCTLPVITQCILCIALILVAAGCGKERTGNSGDDDPDTASYISFKADGVQKKYTVQALVSTGHSAQNGLYNGVLQGYNLTLGANEEHIGIFIFSNTDLQTGVYQDPQKATNTDGEEVPVIMLNYIDATGKGYISMGAMADKNGVIHSLPGSQNIVADAKLSVTKISKTFMEGTFSGTVFLATDATFSTKIAITGGAFKLKRL